jgi:hypothetical protein
MYENQLRPVQVDGCAVGLKSLVNGMPIYKPWKIATNDAIILEALGGLRCPGVDVDHQHKACSGRDTKATESYTNDFVQKVHDAFKLSVENGPFNAAIRGLTPNSVSPSSSNALYSDKGPEPFRACLATIDELKRGHRPKMPAEPPWYSACVAKTVPPKEVRNNQRARDAIKAEGDKLQKANTWDLSTVRERAHVEREARIADKTVVFGLVFPICVIKNSEMGEEDHVYKGRLVFQGNRARDEYGRAARFQEMTSAPASMQAGKVADAYGLLPNNATEQADAQQAYIQCDLLGDETWVELPKDLQPEEWAKY